MYLIGVDIIPRSGIIVKFGYFIWEWEVRSRDDGVVGVGGNNDFLYPLPIVNCLAAMMY
jgi:hypothetical protein